MVKYKEFISMCEVVALLREAKAKLNFVDQPNKHQKTFVLSCLLSHAIFDTKRVHIHVLIMCYGLTAQ